MKFNVTPFVIALALLLIAAASGNLVFVYAAAGWLLFVAPMSAVDW